MTAEELKDLTLHVTPNLVEFFIYLAMLLIAMALMVAIIRIPREIRKNRTVLTHILRVLQSNRHP